MLHSNTMRYATDEFAFNKSSLLTSKVPFDIAGQTSIDGFTIKGAEPSGTSRRFMFKVDDKLWIFSESEPTEHTGTGDFEDVIENGNTAADLETVTSVPAWVGKKIYPIIALYAPIDGNTPIVRLGLKVTTDGEIYEKIVDSAEIKFGRSSQIITAIADTATAGTGTVSVTVRLKSGDGWSDFLSLNAAEGKIADTVQFRARYRVSTISGADSAKVNKILLKYIDAASGDTATIVSGDTAELYSVVKNFGADLSTAILSVRHKPLADSQLRAFVNFAPAPKKRTFIDLGTATGSEQQFVLGVNGIRDTGIDQSSIRLFAGGQPLVNFGYNTEVSEVTISTTAGKVVTASYEYNNQPEIWREMSCEVNQQPYDDGSVQSRYIYSLADEERGLQVANIRLELYRLSGHVDDEQLGTGTGSVQMFVLAHAAKFETLTCNADFSYDADSQIITCTAPVGTKIVASYDWLGEQQTLYSWSAGYTAAL